MLKYAHSSVASAYFSFNKCPNQTQDGAKAKFREETDYSVEFGADPRTAEPVSTTAKNSISFFYLFNVSWLRQREGSNQDVKNEQTLTLEP